MNAGFHTSCTGCSLCLLACPVWRQTHDIRLTPHGRAKAMQHGASAAELGASISSCTLCGACEPACPEKMPLVEMILELRQQVPLTPCAEFMDADPSFSARLLLPGKALRQDEERLARIAGLLDVDIATDDGSDIALALECGAPVPPGRMAEFLSGLQEAKKLIVAEGLLLRRLRAWLPAARVTSLGEALSAIESVRARLRASDLYVIEPRAYHGDHGRLVRHYEALRAAVGFATNLDMQRLAIATTASSAPRSLGLASVDAADQARWILEGRAYERVVVEDAGDCAVFASVTDRPVVHLGDV
jgi:ferredoxin